MSEESPGWRINRARIAALVRENATLTADLIAAREERDAAVARAESHVESAVRIAAQRDQNLDALFEVQADNDTLTADLIAARAERDAAVAELAEVEASVGLVLATERAAVHRAEALLAERERDRARLATAEGLAEQARYYVSVDPAAMPAHWVNARRHAISAALAAYRSATQSDQPSTETEK